MERRIWGKSEPAPDWLRKEDEGEDWTEEFQFESRPRTRSDCRHGRRPCGFVACRYHLFLDVTANGSIKADWTVPPWEMQETCALDVVERLPTGMGRKKLARLYGMTTEAIRLILKTALSRIRIVAKTFGEDGSESTPPIITQYVVSAVKQGDDADRINNVIDFASGLSLTAQERKELTRIALLKTEENQSA